MEQRQTLVFQAQMVFIRQCNPSQEAQRTLPPWGLGPQAAKTKAEFTDPGEGGLAPTMGASASSVKSSGFGFLTFDLSLESLGSHTRKVEMGVETISSGNTPRAVSFIYLH